MGRQTVTYLSALRSETHPSAETFFCGTLKIDTEKTLKPSRRGKVEKTGEDVCETPHFFLCVFMRTCIISNSDLSCALKLNSI